MLLLACVNRGCRTHGTHLSVNAWFQFLCMAQLKAEGGHGVTKQGAFPFSPTCRGGPPTYHGTYSYPHPAALWLLDSGLHHPAPCPLLHRLLCSSPTSLPGGGAAGKAQAAGPRPWIWVMGHTGKGRGAALPAPGLLALPL